MSSQRIVHSGLDTHECTILCDDVQMCAECLIPNAQSFRSKLGELAESRATPEYTYTLAALEHGEKKNRNTSRSYREFLHMIKNLLNT